MANRRASISAGLRADATGWTRGLNQAHAATQRFASNTAAAMKGAQKGSTNAGMGMLMLSQGIDDIQYGFKGIVNNIAPLVMALGGSSGLAGALTIAGVAANQLGIYWDELSGKTARLAKASRDAAFQQEMASRAIAAAGKEGAAEMDRTEKKAKWNQDAAKFEESLYNRRKAVRDATAEADKAELTGSEYSINLQKEKIDRLNEEIDLTDQLAQARKEAARDTEMRANLAGRVPRDEARLKELQSLKASREKEEKLIAGTLEAMTKDVSGSSNTSSRVKPTAATAGLNKRVSEIELKKRLAKNTADNAEQARLEASVPGMKAELERLMLDESGKRVNDLENQAGPVAEQNKREREAKDKAALADELQAFYGNLKKAVDIVSDAAIEAAEKAAQRAKENAEKEARLKEKIEGEKMAAESSLESRMARHRGKNKKADKIDDAAEINDLVKNGWNPDDAEDFVKRKRDQAEDEKLGPGRRKIRSLRAKDENKIPAAGIMPLPIKPKKGEAGMPAADKGAGAAGEKSLSILERIEENTRKTAAERQTPAKRS